MRSPPRVALLVESSRGYGRGVLRGIAEYARSHGPWLLCYEPRGPAHSPPAWLGEWACDGIIASVETRQIAQAIRDLQVPAVDIRGLRIDPDLPFVGTEEAVVARLAVDHFLERGFRRFAYCGCTATGQGNDRARCFAGLVAQAGFACAIAQPPEGTGACEEHDPPGLLDRPAGIRWLRSLPKPVALLACNDVCGQQVLVTCREAGLAVPAEVAVLGVDDDDVVCELAEPRLSSVVPDTQRIGYEAAALLGRLMAGQRPAATLLVPPRGLAARGSTDVLAVPDPELATALAFIRRHACEGITVEDVLKAVPLSRRALERRFADHFRRSPKGEILRVQLEQVKQLLADTDLSLAQIAARTGFRHAEYLSVVFKEKTGQTPSRFRAAQRRGVAAEAELSVRPAAPGGPKL
jgi:LacI family transcriptional regulator